MAIDKVWVLAEAGDAGPTPITLELLTEARSVASTVEAVAWGSETAALAAALGEYGATTVYDVGDLGGSLPGVPVSAALAALIEGGNAPDAILIPATYDGRDVAGRLSVKLDRPVLTNVDRPGGRRRRPVEPAPGVRREPHRDGPLHRARVRPSSSIRAKSFAAGAGRRRRGRGRGRRGARDRCSQRRQAGGAARRGAQRSQAGRGVRGGLRVVGASATRRTTRSSRSWPSCCTERPAPAAPSSTPDGCRTRTRSARPARR